MSAARRQQQQPRPYKGPPAETTSGDTVTVGCKLPNGMHLDFNTPGQPLRRVTLRGTNSALIVNNRPVFKDGQAVGGFGITPRVPRQFFEEWMSVNAEHPAVKNGLIFAHEEHASVVAMAADREGLRTGLEQLDPDKPGKDLEALKVAD